MYFHQDPTLPEGRNSRGFGLAKRWRQVFLIMVFLMAMPLSASSVAAREGHPAHTSNPAGSGAKLEHNNFSHSELLARLADFQSEYGTQSVEADLSAHLEGNTIVFTDRALGVLWLYLEPGGRAIWAGNTRFIEETVWHENKDVNGVGTICVSFESEEYCSYLFRSQGDFESEVFLVRQHDAAGTSFSYWVATLHNGIPENVQAAMKEHDGQQRAISAEVPLSSFNALVNAYAAYAQASTCAQYGLAFAEEDITALENFAKSLQEEIPATQQTDAWAEGSKTGLRMQKLLLSNPPEGIERCASLRNEVNSSIETFSGTPAKPF